MESLNKDILSEISECLLHSDLYNLKLALPNLNITENLFLKSKEQTLKIFFNYKSGDFITLFKNLYFCRYWQYAFKITKYKTGFHQHQIDLIVNCHLICYLANLCDFYIQRVDNLVCLTISDNDCKYIFYIENYDQLIRVFFRSRKLNNIYQLDELPRSESIGQLIRANVENLKLNQLSTYLRTRGRLRINLLSIKTIFLYLDDKDKEIFIKSIENIENNRWAYTMFKNDFCLC